MRELEAFEHLGAAAPCLGACEVVQAPDHLEVLQAGQVLVDRGVLSGEPDDVPQLLRVTDDVVSRHGGVTRVRVEEGREDPHNRGLARAVRPEQSEHRARLDVQVHTVERVHVPE